MFFELHNEKIIGYKRLSDADLGTSPRSHQTHIGLSEYSLKFLPNRDAVSEDSIFIYEDKFEYIDAYFDRIENPNGTFRSPKIKIGDRRCVSIVSTIREIVKSKSDNLIWYLVWFGLKSEKIVFLLFNSDSEDYNQFKIFGLNLDGTGTKAINGSNIIYSKLIAYIEQKININGEDVLKELEIITQIDRVIPNKRFKAYDINMANCINKTIGEQGEKYVNLYLGNLVKSGQILSFIWYNQEQESGLPYDFSIQDCRNNIIYLDVKTTGYNFEQKMIFSSQEIDYISSTSNPYSIYRVYKNINNTYSLRICDNFKKLATEVNSNTKNYQKQLDEIKVGFRGAKLAISPAIAALTFNHEIAI